MAVPFLFNRKHPYYRIYVAFMPFFVMIFVGTLGYMLLEDYDVVDALYMTIVTMSTVGYMEVHPLSHEGRVFTMVLIFINITLFTAFVSYTTRYFLDGTFQNYYKNWKMKHKIEELKNHIVICGFGRNGQSAARVLHRNNIEFVIIEKHGLRTDMIDFPVEYYLTGDAGQDQTLIDAGIKNARGIITTLPDDSDNVFIVLTARELNSKLKIISRASHDNSISKLKTAGAHNIIMPDKIGGHHMAALVSNPDVNEFMDYLIAHNDDNCSIEEVTISRSALLKDLNIWFRTGVTVLGLRSGNGNYILNPGSDSALTPGDKLIVMGSKTQLNTLYNLV